MGEKARGTDGFVTFLFDISKTVLDNLNCKKRHLSCEQRRVTKTLLSKNNKDKFSLKNWRHLSLLILTIRY